MPGRSSRCSRPTTRSSPTRSCGRTSCRGPAPPASGRGRGWVTRWKSGAGGRKVEAQGDQRTMARSKRKPESPFLGRWHIVSMSAWGEEYVNEEVQAFLEFDAKGLGEFQFGYV